jgi:hypothetical protein
MPVQRETFTVNSPWTTESMADGFQQAFAFAGFGDFLSTFVNGSFRSAILPVVYDASKALGTAYHWFMFGGQEIFYSTATGWNTVSNAPTSTQYRDFIASQTNTSVNHYRMALLNSNADTSITVYKSGVLNANFSWFLIRCGTISFNFHIPRTPPNPFFVDQNIHYYHPILFARAVREDKGGSIKIARLPIRLRSSRCAGEGLRSVTLAGYFGANNTATLPWSMAKRDIMQVFNFTGNFANSSTTDANSTFVDPGMVVPVDFSNTNTYVNTDKTPIFIGARLLDFADHFMPSDFGFAGYYGPPNVDQLSQYRNGTQKWDIIEVPSSAANPVDDDQVTPLFIARTID